MKGLFSQILFDSWAQIYNKKSSNFQLAFNMSPFLNPVQLSMGMVYYCCHHFEEVLMPI